MMIWFILLLGLILRLVSLNQSLWLDEAINVLASQKFSFVGMITEYAKADFHPPGYFIMLWLWTKIFGISEISVRIPSVIFGVLTIYIVYLISQKLYSKRVGIFSGLLLAVNPLHIYYSQEARMYALATLAVSLNILLFLKLVKGEKLNLIFLTLSNIFVLLSDYIAYFIFPAEFVFLYLIKKSIIKKWFMALLLAAVSVIWWLPIFLSQLNVGFSASANLPVWKSIVGGFDPKAVPLTFVKFIIGRISLDNKAVYFAILLPLGGFFVYLLWRGFRTVGEFEKKLLLAWIIIPVGLAAIISLVIPVYNYFRVLYVLPAFIILVALGILSAKLRLQYIFLTTTALIALVCSLIYLLNPSYQREDWRGLVDFFRTQNRKSLILFESSGSLSPFDYYAKGQLNARGALKNFPAKKDEDLADLDYILKNFNNVYLVNYLVDISDPSRLVSKKLESLGYKQVDTVDFNGLGFLYNYKK